MTETPHYIPAGAPPAVMAPQPPSRLQAAAIVLLVFAVAAFLYLWDPVDSLGWAPCPFHAATGGYCPGCGTLRALHELLHGRVLTALDLNALTIGVLPFLVYPFLSQAAVVVRGRPLRPIAMPPALPWALLGVVLVFWELRNIPAWPFTVLAP